MTQRLSDLKRFYQILELLGGASGARCLSTIKRAELPTHGVYFFFEPGEYRTDSGSGMRVVRVGTHAIIESSKTKLWTRLSQHRGSSETGLGNHRGSIFRLLVGEAIQRRDSTAISSWGVGSTANAVVRAAEVEAEKNVSEYIGQMRVLAVSVPDRIERSIVEMSSIALLSNYGKMLVDQPSTTWLGAFSGRERVRDSGLWNSRDVDATFNETALTILERSTSGSFSA